MILIADSGATKTDWCLINNGKCSLVFETLGLNPTYVSSLVISDEIASAAKHFGNASAVEKVFFYGAGCADEQKRNDMKSRLLNSGLIFNREQNSPSSSLELRADRAES